MTLDKLIEQARKALQEAIAARQAKQDALIALRSDPNLTEERATAAIAERDAADREVSERQAKLDELLAEQRREEEIAELQARLVPTGSTLPAYDRVARIGAEERTYRKDQDPNGQRFLRDVVNAMVFHDFIAAQRLARHMEEEKVERGAMLTRATDTSNFDGLVVPQYLVDMFGKHAKAGRPFADICRSHPLPPDGMTVHIGRGVTPTQAGEQVSQGTAVAEQDYDDTLVTIPVLTNAGQQTMSQQAVRRSVGALDITLEDLFREYGTALDRNLINRATGGLSAVATPVTYTDADPTAAELYPRLQEAMSGVEEALLDQMQPDSLVAVMHTRRWRWMNAAMTTAWPLVGQPRIPAENAGVNFGEVYGRGFRGLLPDGTPVVVDNNIATNKGAGADEDEIYFVSRDECHLWEDPSAPYYIRAEEVKAATLEVLLVLFGFYAFTFERRPHARKITGTGLVTPTWTG